MTPQELAELITATSEELMKRGENLLLMSEKLRSEAKALRRLEPAPESAPAVIQPPEPAPESDLGPIEIEEMRSVNRFGDIVNKTMAIEVCQRMGTFTRQEFAEAIGLKGAAANRWLMALFNDHRLERFELEGAPRYRVVQLGNPREHATKLPPERERPSYELAQATGMPVRIRTERSDRRGRSTPGQRQKIVNRDRAWERQEEAKAKRAAEQQAKAKAEKGQARRKKNSIPVT